MEEDLLVVSPLKPVRTVGTELPLQPPSLSAGITWSTRPTRSTRSTRCLHSRHSTGLGRRRTTGTGWSARSTCRWLLYLKKKNTCPVDPKPQSDPITILLLNHLQGLPGFPGTDGLPGATGRQGEKVASSSRRFLFSLLSTIKSLHTDCSQTS